MNPRSPATHAAPRWAVVLAFVSHVAITFTVFPAREAWRDAPFLADDYAARFRYALTRAQLLERGQLEGYDPAFLAGFPECGHLLAGGHVWTVGVAALGPALGEARAFNLVTVALVLSTVPLLALAAWALELGAAASWVPLLALPVVWTGVPFAFPMTGSPIWLAGSALALATAAFYRRFVAEGRLRDAVLAALGAAAIGTVHELAAALVIAHALPVVAARRLRPAARVLGGTLAIVGFAVLANLHWLIPFVARRDVALGYGGGTDGVLDARFTAFALVYPHGLPVLCALYGLAAAGVRSLVRARERALGWFVAAFTALPVAFAFVGYAFHATTWTEPYRFVVPATLGLVIPAALGLARAEGRVTRALRRAWPWAGAALAFGLCLWSPISPPLPVRAGLGGEERGLVTLLRTRVDSEHRLLLEDSAWEDPERDWMENLSAPGHHYFGSHLPTLLPELTGLELVTGAYVGPPFIRHQTVRFESRRLDGRPLGAWSQEELRALFVRYAIGEVLVWSAEARAALAAQPELVEAHGGVGAFSLFRVRAPSSRFMVGSGRIETSLDRIELSDLVAVGGVVAIRYHYDPRLASDPPVRIERVVVSGDPIGFVALRDPPPRVRLGFRPRGEPIEPGGWARHAAP